MIVFSLWVWPELSSEVHFLEKCWTESQISDKNPKFEPESMNTHKARLHGSLFVSLGSLVLFALRYWSPLVSLDHSTLFPFAPIRPPSTERCSHSQVAPVFHVLSGAKLYSCDAADDGADAIMEMISRTQDQKIELIMYWLGS